MEFVEFDYVTEKNKTLVIYGEKNGFNIKFKAVDEFGSVVSKAKLSKQDVESIEDLIYENAIEEICFESDWYDRQSD